MGARARRAAPAPGPGAAAGSIATRLAWTGGNRSRAGRDLTAAACARTGDAGGPEPPGWVDRHRDDRADRDRVAGAGSKRSPSRTPVGSASSSTCRTRRRGRSTRRGGIRTTARTTQWRSRSATAIANRIPNVWIERVRSKSQASSRSRLARPRSPRVRSRRVSGTAVLSRRPRGARRMIVRTAARLGPAADGLEGERRQASLA